MQSKMSELEFKTTNIKIVAGLEKELWKKIELVWKRQYTILFCRDKRTNI